MLYFHSRLAMDCSLNINYCISQMQLIMWSMHVPALSDEVTTSGSGVTFLTVLIVLEGVLHSVYIAIIYVIASYVHCMWTTIYENTCMYAKLSCLLLDMCIQCVKCLCTYPLSSYKLWLTLMRFIAVMPIVYINLNLNSVDSIIDYLSLPIIVLFKSDLLLIFIELNLKWPSTIQRLQYIALTIALKYHRKLFE